MKKDEIKKYLSQFPNVIIMTREASKLKEAGESEIMVNRCIAELRKEALQNSEKMVKLTPTAIEETQINPIGFLSVQLAGLNRPIVEFNENTAIL